MVQHPPPKNFQIKRGFRQKKLMVFAQNAVLQSRVKCVRPLKFTGEKLAKSLQKVRLLFTILR
jgi:hypothetical protein